jgi:hypothetical protein
VAFLLLRVTLSSHQRYDNSVFHTCFAQHGGAFLSGGTRGENIVKKDRASGALG